MSRQRFNITAEYVKPFPTNLRNLIEERKLKHDDLAKEIGIARQTIGYYANGTSKPDYETMKKIANYFGVTIDWLSGVDGATRSLDTDLQKVCKYTGLNEEIVSYFKELQISKNSIKTTYISADELQNDIWKKECAESSSTFINSFLSSYEFKQMASMYQSFKDACYLDPLSPIKDPDIIKYKYMKLVDSFLDRIESNLGYDLAKELMAERNKNEEQIIDELEQKYEQYMEDK